MAYTSQSDQIEAVVRVLWQHAMALGMFRGLRLDNWDDVGGKIGRLAKASGASVGEVEAWLSGESLPATGQALACLSALPSVAAGGPVPAVNGTRS